MIKCPYCNNTTSNYKQCEHCGEILEEQCPYCKETISINSRICPFCNSKLRTNSISILIKITYIMLFINAFIPYWFANSINKHPIFWHNMTKKNDDFNDLISSIVGLAVISAIPAIVAFVSNYRKRVSIISIIVIILLCICNIFLVTQIH